MKVPYSFSVLRYVHDPVTQEFVNIGVALFSPEGRYFRAICTTSYGRITHVFQRIDGPRFRQLSHHVQQRICAAGEEYEAGLLFEAGHPIEYALAKVLPPDDSAIQFSKAGVGLSEDLDRTLQELYQRHVERYAASADAPRRTDEEVWRVFREPLDRIHLTPHLKAKRIVASDFEYEFQHAWKNQRWHVYEAVSFDLVEGASITNKANRWLGQATSLLDSTEPFHLHLLLGEPQDERLRATFVKAQNILNKIPGRKELIRESEAEVFALELAGELRGLVGRESGTG
jgi:hypothetical protein